MDADYDKTHRMNWSYRIQNISALLQDLKLQVYWDRVEHLMDDRERFSSSTSPRFYSMQTDASTQTYGAKLQAALQIGPGTLKSGLDYYNRNWDATNRRAAYFNYRELAMIPDATIENVGLFSEYTLPLGSRLSLTGGLRGDLTHAEAGRTNTMVTAGSSKEFSSISANLQLNYTPFKELTIFTGLGRGTRTPDQQELYLDLPGNPAWRGNQSLKATVNHQADLGAKYATNRFYINASIFYSDLQDYVNFYQASPTLKSYQNIHASIWGAELGSQVSLPADLFLRGTLSYTEGRNISGNRPLSEIPPLRGTISIRYDNGKFFAELLETLSREQDRIDSSLNEQKTAGWVTTDLKAGYHYKGFSVTGGINNLLDTQYYSHLSYLRDPFVSGVGYRVPENGRNVYLTMAYKF
jgi:iron complex outermembrane receptor protein